MATEASWDTLDLPKDRRSYENSENNFLQCDAKTQIQLPPGLHQGLRDESRAELLDDQLSTCVDWFYGACRGGREKFDAPSEKAQLIIDDIVNALRALLYEVDSVASSNPGRKRKRAKDFHGAADEIGLTHGEERSVKRMRGMLESSEDVHIRTRDRIPIGRRSRMQNSVFHTEYGELALFTMSVATASSSLPLEKSAEKSTRETFVGNLTILLSKTQRKAKIRAFFTQRVFSRGTFAFTPILSFHAIIPNDSKVFDVIRHGDVDGLRRLLEIGNTSLTDCDEDGHSLLWHWMHEACVGVKITDLRMIKFLVEHGADVNGMEGCVGFKDYM
ncbi:MAG: hypothetical protein Q9160_001827 [Pyrenula sp. 1 TL-2023]